MEPVSREKKKERPEGNVIASVKAIMVTILGINSPLFETDARLFLAPPSVYSELKTTSQKRFSKISEATITRQTTNLFSTNRQLNG